MTPIGDTGAMMCVAGVDILHTMNVSEEELLPVTLWIKAADNRRTSVKVSRRGRNDKTGECNLTLPEQEMCQRPWPYINIISDYC